jgi:hypothetical protein
MCRCSGGILWGELSTVLELSWAFVRKRGGISSGRNFPWGNCCSINSGIFSWGNFLLGVDGGVFPRRILLGGGNFWHDLINYQKSETFITGLYYPRFSLLYSYFCCVDFLLHKLGPKKVLSSHIFSKSQFTRF